MTHLIAVRNYLIVFNDFVNKDYNLTDHSRGDLAETFQNITIVSPEPDKTLIKLISEVSKQQKKQQTLLREIEIRLTNQKMIENATKNHIENPPHHSTSSKHHTMQQQQHAPPHLVPINYICY